MNAPTLCEQKDPVYKPAPRSADRTHIKAEWEINTNLPNNGNWTDNSIYLADSLWKGFTQKRAEQSLSNYVGYCCG